jgi:23S rRNA (guanosine2251-2'-O)-methyltransferase
LEQLEGKICVAAALQARQRKISLIIIRSGLHERQIQPILDEAEQQKVSLKYASRAELDAMAHGKTHGGVIALATPKPPLSLETMLEQVKKQHRSPAVLLLEGIDDNQNLGFTLRSAEAMGIDAVLLKKHLWDFDGAAVSRASSGAFERMPIALLDQVDRTLPRFKNPVLKLFGCIANAKRTMYDVDLTVPVILAIGGEKRGLSAAVRNHCDVFIKIPMASDIGSLSLSHSASVVMAEMMRQRIVRDGNRSPG